MIIIHVKDGENIDRALKRYRNKTRDTKLLKTLRDRKQFTKKSAEKRREKEKAVYKEILKGQD